MKIKNIITIIKNKDKKQIILYTVLFIGIAFMVREYIGGRSFWLDEAALGLNISKSFKELLLPIGSGQMAPILFLLTAKIPTIFLGISDYSLRIIPLLFGIGSLYIFFLISKKILNKTAAIISLLLFILSDKIIYYTTEFKQYSAEVFFSVLLFYLFILMTDTGLNLKRSILIGVIGIIAIWFSYPSIIVITSVTICFLYYFIKKKDKKSIISTVTIGLIWLANIFAEYFYHILIKDYRIEGMKYYWSYAFMPFPPKTSSDFLWLPKSIKDFFIYIYRNDSNLFSGKFPIIQDIFSYMLITFFIIGIIYTFLKRKGHLSLFVLLILFLAIAASALKKYPFSERTILYIAPLIFFISAYGIWLTIKYLRKIHISISIILLLFIFFFPILSGIYHLIEPTYKSEIKSVVSYYYENRKPGDKLYVEEYYLIQFYFYSDKDLVDFTSDKDEETLEREISGNDRVWVIGSIGDLEKQGKLIDHYKIKTLASILANKWPFNRYRDKIISLNNPNAEIYLYDFSEL
ncbi:MAG: glycosyltransferase family 39 protein [Actinobacteria bacterium]|nr:glycosyltransferase family 39 protein [Chloroflexota bacterium]MBE3128168.1 glycosyltransferase family 39 protein [Actinomycetota bacterium]